MSESVYDTVNVADKTECEEPPPGTESHEHQYIKLQQPKGVCDTVRVAQHEVSCQQWCYIVIIQNTVVLYLE